MSLEQTKQSLLGQWVSIAPEIRPSAAKNADGSLRPFYLTRDFKYLGEDRFELTIVNNADPYGKAPLARIYLRGHMHWQGDHPIASGAQKVDFTADEDYTVTPLAQRFADLLNKVAGAGYATWEVNVPQTVLGKSFAPFGLVPGHNFMEYDLVYLNRDMLFWRSQHRWTRFRQGRKSSDELADPARPEMSGFRPRAGGCCGLGSGAYRRALLAANPLPVASQTPTSKI